MKFLIANKWQLDVQDDMLIESHASEMARPYTHYLVAKQRDVAHEIWCIERLCDLCGYEVDSIVEYMAGVGCSSTIFIHKFTELLNHYMFDLDENCVEHLSRTFPDATVRRRDFFKVAGKVQADMSIIDFNQFTMQKLYKDSRLSLALEHVFQSSSVTMITDSAVGYLHINKGIYADICGYDINNFEDYVYGMSTQFYAHGGHHITHATYFSKAAYFLTVNGDWNDDIVIERSPQNASGYFRRIL
mgnify:CR=1 FL=1